MLVIWCSQEVKTLKEVIGATLSQHAIDHRVEPDVSGFPYVSPGDVVLACGTKALAVLQAMGVTPKGRTVTSTRGTPIMVRGAKVLTTFDPGVVFRDYARLPDIQWDIQLAVRLHNTRTTAPKVGDYKLVESFHEVIDRIDYLWERTGLPVEVACDLETKGLDEFAVGAWIISCSFTVDAGTAQVAYFLKSEKPVQPDVFTPEEDHTYWESLWVQINWLLTTPKVSLRGANFKFDSRWLNQCWSINCTNHKFDTTLVGSLLDENRSNSLKLHAKLFTNLGGYEDGMDKYDFSCLEKVPVPEIVQYNGGDTDATLQVATHFKKQLLKDRKLVNFYTKVTHPASKAFERLERNGIYVDVQYYHRLQSELEEEISRIHSGLIGMMPATLRSKYAENLKVTRHALLRDFLFTPAGLNLKPHLFTEAEKLPSTAMEHLLSFKDNPAAAEFISLFNEYGSATKTLSTYVIGFLKHLRSDGKFHPSFMLHRGGYGDSDDDTGTVTGRTSAKDPAVQTIPKHTKWSKRLRRAFIAPPGYTILNLDYSQGELRICAVVAEEPTMIQAYLDNKDLHAITAAGLNGYSFEEFMLLPDELRDELRSGGKAGNFGLIYGMQHIGFREYAWNSYGVSMSEEEAFNTRNAFFDLYSRLLPWHTEAKKFAKVRSYVRSPLGRVRHLPLINSPDRESRSKAERQAINSPIQATLSDMMQMAMVSIDRQYGNEDIRTFMMTHDSLSLYVPIERAVEWSPRLRDIMENLPLKKDFGWESPLKFTADSEVGVPDDDGVISLAKLQKLKPT